MYNKPTGPLEIARTVLKPETIAAVRRTGYSSRGYSILDRWALNQPDELRKLEAMGKIDFDLKLYGQQQTEYHALMTPAAKEMESRGMSDFEILQALEIDMSLRITE